MDNGRVECGEGRKSHSVTLQWCSHDQPKTTTLTIVCNFKYYFLHCLHEGCPEGGPTKHRQK